ncbi:acyl-CoA dehydrogenase family protein [Phyllobacterium pellucidum]|uniref:acyl-CoA dehydrogenase family protein n=1 Tax=Phyllobacterium pellucidum TaxID=2740464 RepID=UPI001F1D926B|nr:acyl-CoA dehydrogenase family protein [Phyllobacterium sp. T1018]UGY10573.1 acyl-CoA dehydrogenase family protein [Phyllobacterium sp. T1018]
MNSMAHTSSIADEASSGSAVDIAHSLTPALAARAAEFDETDTFVAENYKLLKEAGLVHAGVPHELGGGGADVGELAEMLRVLAHGCSSTALAFSMHTHQVAIPAWRWRHQKALAVEPLLKRIAAEKLILLSSGGSDWIGGSGDATKVEGGYRIKARKVFTSGANAGDILMTGAILRREDGSAQVIHFGVPMKSAEVKVVDTWKALGMRGTGSNDVAIEDFFVPDASVAFSRKAGEWHPVFQIIATTAFPLIYAVYLGVAESARDIAIHLAKKKQPTETSMNLAGRMDTSLRAAQLAHQWMVKIVERNSPSAESVNEVMIGRSLVAEHAIKTVELALELAGGAGFYRSNGLEQRFRDIQGARFHPLQQGPQARYAGAMALGQSVNTVF